MKYLLLLMVMTWLSACDAPATTTVPAPDKLPYSTSSDSARYYFALGWHQIMDEGRYGQAEVSYRKAVAFDPGFLIAKATLGRLTLDTTERRRIEQELQGGFPELPAEERALLGLYTDFVRFTNLREHDPVAARKMLVAVLPQGQAVLGRLVRQYPEEPYLKSEYVELINSTTGPAAALDSLAVLTQERHADNPFLLGFKASLLAATGAFPEALQTADQLAAMTADTTEPKPWAVYADVYLAMDSLKLAKQYADRANRLDPRNLDASRLQERINQRIMEVAGLGKDE